MSLVSYEYSDSSDIEENENETDKMNKYGIPLLDCLLLNDTLHESLPASGSKSDSSAQLATSPNVSNSLFNLLPQPAKKKVTVEDDDDEFLKKKESLNDVVKPKTKITVPSLSDFKDLDSSTSNPKPKVINGKKSGLLSMLPQPKNTVSVTSTTKSFVPHILTKKPVSSVKKEEKPLMSSVKRLNSDLKSLAKDYSDDSDDDEVHNDFFSIHKTEDIPEVPFVSDKTEKVVTKSYNHNSTSNIINSYFKPDIVQEHEILPTNVPTTTEDYGNSANASSSTENGYNVESSNSNEMILDDEAILKLCGARGKRKREEIQIVDVNQTEVLADAREWLLKGLMDDTTKRVSSSKRRGDEPTSQQRRKHQITYLAHQAKANEAELQNQWANNRMSKRQTQSKYGF
ncbi:unnamed protein product [Diatraea saccharalis]|uniref:Proline-rich protein PRCC n=1 Tax=Diatraea saccharalis TaxID=40085 RepID=A0A9N9RHC6_9NEOP|nr:unnamed protein product [Diatraea saccharalis]